MTASVNQPDFAVLQKDLIDRFCEERCRFIVINDCPEKPHATNFHDATLYQKIEQTCSSRGIEYLRMPQHLHRDRRKLFPRASVKSSNEPAARHSATIQWGLNTFGLQSNETVLILDSDMFPIRKFSIQKMLGGALLAGPPQSRRGKKFFSTRSAYYLWIGILALNTSQMPDKDQFSVECGKVNGLHVDAGGQVHHYLKAHPNMKVREIRHLWSGTWGPAQEPEWLGDGVRQFLRTDPKNLNGKYYSEIYDDTFFHFRAGSNWDKMEPAALAARQKKLIDALNSLT